MMNLIKLQVLSMDLITGSQCNALPQKYIQTNRHTNRPGPRGDLTGVGHMNRGTGIKQKPKSENKKVWTNLN